MRSPLATVFLALVTSLATVGAIELLRAKPSAPPALGAVDARAEPAAPRPTEPLTAPPQDDRLAELERRIAALEQSWASQRVPVVPRSHDDEEDAPVAHREELRELVLEWIGEEREMRRLESEREELDRHRRELEFGTRVHATELAREHGLVQWEEEKLAAVFLAIEKRRDEVERGIDPSKDDPIEAERRFVEFDEWADRYMREELGRELFERLFGENE